MRVMKRIASFTVLVMCASTLVMAQGRGQDQAQAQAADWQRMHALGLSHKTAMDLYMALKTEAGGGQVSPPFTRLPDWSGLWLRAGGGPAFAGAGPGGVMPKLMPAAVAKLKENAELAARGAAYQENISDCGPPGYPMWLDIPFMREFIVRPEETWLSSETVNNVRRIYTDGRDHPPVEDRYPLYYGDSIGFWDNQKLVIHTTQLMNRSFVGQLNLSEQMETVEIWEKINATTIEAKVWIYDPTIYLEPWYVTRLYAQVPNPKKELRMNYWNCGENPNNEVYKTKDGDTAFKDLRFAKDNKDKGK
jgi:hypothetical protein